MKKTLTIVLMLLTGLNMVVAQNELRGKVVDSDGKPIAGVKITDSKGENQTVSDMNGQFKFNTAEGIGRVKASYMGLADASAKAKSGMVIKMGSNSWWSKKPEKYQWLVGPQVVLTSDEGHPSFGLMVGRVKNWGWYVRGNFNGLISHCDDYSYDVLDNAIFDGRKPITRHWSATAGVMRRLGCPIHLYIGAGYTERRVAWEAIDGQRYLYRPDSYIGPTGEAGLMVRFNNFFVNGSAMLVPAFYKGEFGYDYSNGDGHVEVNVSIGLGILF